MTARRVAAAGLLAVALAGCGPTGGGDGEGGEAVLPEQDIVTQDEADAAAAAEIDASNAEQVLEDLAAEIEAELDAQEPE